MKTAFLFPGQGAQFVGMGQDVSQALAPVAELFARAEAACGLPLKKLCFEGPQEELSRTDIAQPAIFTVSVAMLEATRQLMNDQQRSAFEPAFLAGLSLGEYTALHVAGAMDFETGVKLVARRGELMQQAATAVPSGMVSVMGLDEGAAGELCAAVAEGQVLTCANFNCPGQIVLSGQKEACERAAAEAEGLGAKSAVALQVAGAFHSELMAPAAEMFAETLRQVAFADLTAPVIANVDAKPYTRGVDIKDRLLAQLTSPVRWAESMEYLLAEQAQRLYEIGPGRVLAGLMRRIDRKVKVININSLQAIREFTQG